MKLCECDVLKKWVMQYVNHLKFRLQASCTLLSDLEAAFARIYFYDWAS